MLHNSTRVSVLSTPNGVCLKMSERACRGENVGLGYCLITRLKLAFFGLRLGFELDYREEVNSIELYSLWWVPLM